MWFILCNCTSDGAGTRLPEYSTQTRLFLGNPKRLFLIFGYPKELTDFFVTRMRPESDSLYFLDYPILPESNFLPPKLFDTRLFATHPPLNCTLCKKLQYVEFLSKYLDNLAEFYMYFFKNDCIVYYIYFPKLFFTNQIHILAFGSLNAVVITLYYKTKKKSPNEFALKTGIEYLNEIRN